MKTVVDTGLRECEQVIERGLATFVEVGHALLRIRDERLYRESHSTFEDYCRGRWGMSKRHANRQIEAAEVAGTLGPIGPVPNEAVARELAPLKDDPEAMREAWGEASSNGTPTASAVRDVVRRPGPKTAERMARETGRAVVDSLEARARRARLRSRTRRGRR